MKEWTIMFYFAGDNELAPIVVSQVKAIKDAGFQENTDVLVYFDPNEVGVPTRVYDVNRKRKLDQKRKKKKDPGVPGSQIGDGADPFVRSMDEDDVRPDDIPDRADLIASKNLRKALEEQNEVNAEDALENFIGFCREAHQAKHYILYLVGHGMVVGSDTFLPDDNPVSAITLKRLGEILKDFNDKVTSEKGTFELLALHSCSMSAVEVAYELKDTAKYMIASEGPSFLVGWPYRQALKKTFTRAEAINNGGPGPKKRRTGQYMAGSDTEADIQELIEDLYGLTLHNATDFMSAGYSHDLALCSLDSEKITELAGLIKTLVIQLKTGLDESNDKTDRPATSLGKRIKELVLLAHWEAQSYWGENYTDLFDFCRCIHKRCESDAALKDLSDACAAVMAKLDTVRSDDRSERFNGLVIRSQNFGSKFQYSHGLSIYFPWSRPIETAPSRGTAIRTYVKGKHKVKYNEEEQKRAFERYQEYAFNEDLGDDSWVSFLETYFKETERKTRKAEDRAEDRAVEPAVQPRGVELRRFNPDQAARAATRFFNPLGILARVDKVSPQLDDKVGSQQGAACTCPSFKNYPQTTDEEPDEGEAAKGKTAKGKAAKARPVRGKIITNAPAITITGEPLQAFENASDD